MLRPPISLYAFTFFGSFMPIFALASLMIVDNQLSGNEVAIVLASYSIASFICEVPSGALADRTSRKWILVASQALCAIGFACWAITPNFIGFLVGYSLWGVKAALYSGTYEAYVYDELAACKVENKYMSFVGRLSAVRSISALLAALVAVPLSRFGYETIIWCSVSMAIAAMIAGICLPETARTKKVGKNAYARILRDGILTIIKNRRTLYVAFGCAAVSALISMTGDFGPILGRLSGVSLSGMGLFVAISYGVVAVAGKTAAYLATHLKDRFHWLFPVAALALTLSTYILNLPALSLVFVWLYGTSIVRQLYDNELQKCATSDVRATVSSVAGLVTTTL